MSSTYMAITAPLFVTEWKKYIFDNEYELLFQI